MAFEVSEIAPLSVTAPVIFTWSPVVLPVFTLMGAAAASVPVSVKEFVPAPSVAEMELTSAAGMVMVLAPPPLMSPALARWMCQRASRPCRSGCRCRRIARG